ncbi:hypothetical protein ACWDZ4_26365 [Streptomyces sp. NPDC003016]
MDTLLPNERLRPALPRYRHRSASTALVARVEGGGAPPADRTTAGPAGGVWSTPGR